MGGGKIKEVMERVSPLARPPIHANKRLGLKEIDQSKEEVARVR